MNRARSQRFSRPVAAVRGTRRTVQPSHGTPTRSPSANRRRRAERLDLADDLVAEDERQLRARQLAVDDVQVGAADAAREHAEEHLPGRRRRVGHLRCFERLARQAQQHGLHRSGRRRRGGGCQTPFFVKRERVPI